MGQITEDILDGSQCSGCGVCFETEHGYPVLCGDCWYRAEHEARHGMQRATKREL
jgi:hypothetical protein